MSSKVHHSDSNNSMANLLGQNEVLSRKGSVLMERKGTKNLKMEMEDVLKHGRDDKIEIHFGSPTDRANNSKKSNKVRTTKYTILTWAPVSLLLQFRRAANIYFLIISILTAMPFSPKNPGSMIGTFAAVLFFTMLKEAYEDFARYK